MSEENTPVENTQTPESQEPVQQQPEQHAENDSLKKLPVDDLVEIIKETRSEAKNRRLKYKELEGKLATYEEQKKQEEIEQLEKTNEYKALYEKIKEEHGDYDELKEFKQASLEKAKEQVENNRKNLTKAEEDLFAMASKGMTYVEQQEYIAKLITSRTPGITVDNTQSTTRTNKEQKEKNPLRSPGDQDPVLAGLRKARA
jgi:hypothetical protein